MKKVTKKLNKVEQDALDAFLYGPSVISETEAEYRHSLNYGSGFSIGSLRISTLGQVTDLSPNKENRFAPAKQVVADEHHEIVRTCIPGLCVLRLKRI